MYFIYNMLAVIIFILALPVFAVRMVREQGFTERLKQSLGMLPGEALTKVAGRGAIWLHAASVGEIVATSPIVKEIRQELPDIPVVVSAVTTSGYDMAKRIIPEADCVIYFPWDLPGISDSVLDKIRPRVFLMVETELWPNFLKGACTLNVPVMMVNGRISDKSVTRYVYFRRVVKNMLDTIAKFCMQSAIDAEYIIRMGADPERVVITGNTKFDQNYTELSAQDKAALVKALGLTTADPVIVAGSTHGGEEELLFPAFSQVKGSYQTAKFIVAPRDTLRAGELIELAAKYGFKAARRTKLSNTPESNDYDMIIIDTIGELGKIYGLGDIVYVGGSLVPHGGHNILEPAAHGKPIITGPHMFNFKDTYALFSECSACATVHDQGGLAATLLSLLGSPETRRAMGQKALTVINANRGASHKSAVYLKELLEEQQKISRPAGEIASLRCP